MILGDLLTSIIVEKDQSIKLYIRQPAVTRAYIPVDSDDVLLDLVVSSFTFYCYGQSLFVDIE